MRSLTWHKALYYITFVLFALAIVLWILTLAGWLITEPGFEPLNVLVGAVVSSLAAVLVLLKARTAKDVPIAEYRPTPAQRERNRRAMLELVKNIWVKDVLEQSLHGAAMIELGMEEKADAVERPWDMVLQVPGQPNRPLPQGARIVDVFEEMSQSLLILGEPGSGKTTMLLDLARDTIACAEEDPKLPVPVVFNLSSWAGKRQPIAEWLVDELNTRYHIPKKVARPWVESDELLLLLDGLDEVKLEHREACVEAVNVFRQEHLVSLAVCSRVADYEVLTARLELQGAVLLQPLTYDRVAQYLDGTGAELAAVRRALYADPTLRELAQSPLMLSIMTLAYRGLSDEDLQHLESAADRRDHLFDTYVQRMFERRSVSQSYSPQQTTRWLAWLSRKMSEYAQTVFLIEGLQPDWLPVRARRQVHTIARLVSGLFFGLVSGLGGGLFFGLVFGLFFGPGVGLVFGLFGGLVFGLGVGLVVGLVGEWDSVKPVETLKWSWRETGKWLVLGPVFGLGVGLGVWLVGEWFGVLLAGLFFGLVSGLVGGLFGGLVGGLGVGLVSGLVFGLVFGLLGGLGVGLFGGLVGGLVGGPVFGLLVGLLFGLLFGLSNTEIETKTVPNQGIRQSVKNFLIVGLFCGLVLGLVGGLGPGLVLGLVGGLGVGLVGGLGPGLGFGLLFCGGGPAVLHFVLRYVIWRDGHGPWHYIRFLDYAAECIFLRKVGGGYIFIHRLLQDYFASLDQSQTH